VSVVDPAPRVLKVSRGTSDKVFRGVILAGALFSLIVLALISGFLLYRGFEVFKDFGFSFFTSSKWDAASDDGLIPASYGVAAMLVGSVVVATIAVIVAVPFATSVALFLEYYAPQRIKSVLVSILDLIASIPSVIWGIWGYTILMPHAAGWSKSLNHWLGWFPLFKVPAPIFERSPFIAGLLLAMMILPIITSVAREVYSQAPRDQIDAAYGLGASKWGTMRAVVLPFGRGGLVGGTMLGLGRALGETVAVYLVLNLVFKINFQILASVGGNVASLIAGRFGEATPYELKALMAAGLVLFLLTLLVNFIATAIVARTARAAK
jgi:phosphate transport system permease protein